MFHPSLNTLFLDNHLIAVYKPFGVLTQSNRPGGDSLYKQTKYWLKNKFNKKGDVFLGLLHRLDRPVAGGVLFARTSKAASRISKQFREKTIQKIYRAVVLGVPKDQENQLTSWLKKNPRIFKTTVFRRETLGAQRADLSYQVIETLGSYSILEIVLHTGRFHQIRAQLAFMKHPVLGDVKYGAPVGLPERHIALYAHQLIVEHPITGEQISIQSPSPKGWPFTP